MTKTTTDSCPTIDRTNFMASIFIPTISSSASWSTQSIPNRVSWVAVPSIRERKIPLEPGPQHVAEALEPYCSVPHVATVESTYNWYGLADLFESRGWILKLADPTTVKKFKAKFSDDRSDAEFLADRLRLNDLKTTEIIPRNARSFKDLVRLRNSLIQDRSRYAVILINMINNQCCERINRTAIVHWAEELQRSGQLPEKLTAALHNNCILRKVEVNLRMFTSCSEEIKRIGAAIVETARKAPQHCHQYLKILQSIKGCGEVISTVVASEIHDIRRFRNAKNFVSCCRLAPTERLSNGKVKGEGNAKNGNAYLSWAFTELANLVVRFNPPAKKKFDRLLSKRNGLRCRASDTAERNPAGRQPAVKPFRRAGSSRLSGKQACGLPR
ncbi:transposase [Mesosutterella sp. OilRF-GAM-744-9]|uniref:Transposase n=1 Tax=Mesosutterella porci TaxID=2915351 RepID=A0ABS9MQ53_9BURK|nr:transposase [Mesosutterella sp. oilRF-744-WT-GAM-9]MCG5030741.1 transposase [Mesosutterella sp. oilRF-744-WT-GAM-9]